MTLRSAALLVLLGACSGPQEPVERGSPGFVQGFFGGIATDEPNATLIGRDVLTAGGNAVDAATAIYFALSVTMPSQASLGGGGVCMVHDHERETVEALDFLARPSAELPADAARPSAVPGNPRGFFLMHSKYGLLRWEQLVAPAENLARFGFKVSRAFARDVDTVHDALLADPEARRVLASPNGQGLAGEGDFILQVDLAATLGRMRVQGPGDFYVGNAARALVAAVAEAGGTLSLADLRDYTPQWREPLGYRFGNLTLHVPPPPANGGILSAQIFDLLARGDRYVDADPAGRAHLLAESAMVAYAARTDWMDADGSVSVDPAALVDGDGIDRLDDRIDEGSHTPAESLTPPPREQPENPAATTFVVVDREGMAVACGLTLNSLFGTGRIAPGTGVVIAARPDDKGRGATALGPMLAVNQFTQQLYLAIAASGGVTAPTAQAVTALRALEEDTLLEDVVAAPRVHHSGAPDLVYYEEGMARPVVDGLLARGHRVAPARSLGRVNALLCTGGLPSAPESCAVTVDPRGAGLAASPDR